VEEKAMIKKSGRGIVMESPISF